MAKAQIFTLDIIVALGIFILIMLSTAALWYYIREKIIVEERRNDMEIIARNALSVLVETSGMPSKWANYEFNETTITSIGMADEFLLLNQTKMNALALANYTAVKTLLGILGPNYEFSLTISVWNGSLYNLNYTAGLSPTPYAFEIVKAERFALLNNQWTKVAVKLWKRCEDMTC